MQRSKDLKSAASKYLDINVVMRPQQEAVIVTELQKLEDEDGVIRPEQVLDVARDPEHPFHEMIEWDVDKAARRHQLNQARAIIIAAKLVLERKQQKQKKAARLKIRKYVSRGRNQGFKSRASAMTEAETRQHLIRTKLRAIRSAVTQISDVKELDDFRVTVCEEIKKAASIFDIEL